MSGTEELFGLPKGQKEEILYLADGSLYKDLLKRLEEKFSAANKNKDEKYDIFNDVVVFSSRGILRKMENEPIEEGEMITVAHLIAGG